MEFFKLPGHFCGGELGERMQRERESREGEEGERGAILRTSEHSGWKNLVRKVCHCGVCVLCDPELCRNCAAKEAFYAPISSFTADKKEKNCGWWGLGANLSSSSSSQGAWPKSLHAHNAGLGLCICVCVCICVCAYGGPDGQRRDFRVET